MRYVKTVRDTYEDPALVEAGVDHVYLEVSVESLQKMADLKLTPKQARRLAKALRKAAKIAEESA